MQTETYSKDNLKTIKPQVKDDLRIQMVRNMLDNGLMIKNMAWVVRPFLMEMHTQVNSSMEKGMGKVS